MRVFGPQTAMSSFDINISTCTRCKTSEINWSTGPACIGCLDLIDTCMVPDNTGSTGYTCTRCLDLDRLVKHRATSFALYQQFHKVLPQTCVTDIYEFTYPGSYNQWKKLNWYHYTQRRSTIKFFLAGAPWTHNWIHDLNRKLQRQGRRDLLWRGKAYHTSSWNMYTDLYFVFCDYLI